MIDLPAGWSWAALNDLQAAEPRAITDGPFGSNLKRSNYTADGARVVRLQNIGDGTFIDAPAYISLEHFQTLRAHEVRQGDLVLASLGDQLPRACLLPPLDSPAIVKADCIRVRLHPSVDPRWVLYALMAPPTRRYTKDKIHGVGRPRLGLKEIRALPVPVPPLAEQRRIVEALEDHLSRLDAAQSQLAAALLRCRVLRDAAVAELVRGRDVWERHAIGPLLREPLRNGHSAPASGDGCGVRTLTITAVTVDDFSDANTKVTSADPVRVHDLWLEPGDILVQRSNTPELVGTTAMYNGPRDWAIFPDLLIRLRPCDRLLPEFLTAVLRSAPVRRHFRSKAKGLAGSMPKIDQPTIMSTMVPVPSIPEQRRVLEEYRRWNEKIDRLRTALEVADRRAVHLRVSLLRQAFSGRLVLQDPSDEPASALLDRLRAERAAVPNAAGRRARTG